MKLFATILLASLTTVSFGQNLCPKFVRAIHLVEASGKLGPIKGDFVNGKPQALGPLQIHLPYYVDSGVQGGYEKCADLEFSKKVAAAYFARYCPKALKEKNYEVLARTHNGGIGGPKNPKTYKYWLKVKANIK